MRKQLAAAVLLLVLTGFGAGVAISSSGKSCPGNSCHGVTTTTNGTTTSSQPPPTTTATGTTTTGTTTTGTTTTVPTNPTPPPPTVACDLYASPTGLDSNSGTLANPFLTLVKLDQSLAPGQTGCLRGGTYGSTTTESDLGKAGTATSRITITAYPGEKPLVKGWINLNGAYTTISHLEIDGSNALYTTQRHTGCPTTASEALTITASGVIFEHNDYYQSIASLRSNGIGVGWWGTADNTVIRYNTIHDVGGCAAYDHLIYLAHGNNVQVYGNWMWNDGHGWGLQIYPGPTNAKVYNNVIDGAGSGMTIGDNGGLTSTGNQAYHNVILNSVGMTTESGYHICGGALTGAAPVAGSNNSFTSNVAYNNPCGIGGETNVAMSANSTANPLFVDAANHDYRLTSSSPAATWGLWDGN